MLDGSLYTHICTWENLLLAYRKASMGISSNVPLRVTEVKDQCRVSVCCWALRWRQV
jgi:hypothetical protein